MTLVQSVQLFSHVWLFETPRITAYQASLSITNSQSLLKLMSTESVMPSNHLILYCPLLLQPSIFPSIRVFSSESVLQIRWPKYWSFSFSVSPFNEYSGLISFRMDPVICLFPSSFKHGVWWLLCHLIGLPWYQGFPGSSDGKESACNARDSSLIPGLGRSPGEGKVYPLQYSGLENSMGPWGRKESL